MTSIDFDSDDYAYLNRLVNGSEDPNHLMDRAAVLSARTVAAPSVVNFRSLLLAGLDVAPDDPGVHRIATRHLEQVPGDSIEFARAMHRVCLIERTDGAESTGLLIGPDLLLTAAHTLRGVDGIFADPGNVRVHFDRFGSPSAAVFSCGLAPRSDLPTQPIVVASSIRVSADGMTEIADNNLDYVLVRLDQRVGESRLPRTKKERGWMDGSAARHSAPTGRDGVTVLQHPLGLPLHYARGEVFNIRNGIIRYRVDVKGGSSGSPILDRKRRIVGIHTGQVNDNEREGTHFQAIFADVENQRRPSASTEGPGEPLGDEPPVFLPYPLKRSLRSAATADRELDSELDSELVKV